MVHSRVYTWHSPLLVFETTTAKQQGEWKRKKIKLPSLRMPGDLKISEIGKHSTGGMAARSTGDPAGGGVERLVCGAVYESQKGPAGCISSWLGVNLEAQNQNPLFHQQE